MIMLRDSRCIVISRNEAARLGRCLGVNPFITLEPERGPTYAGLCEKSQRLASPPGNQQGSAECGLGKVAAR